MHDHFGQILRQPVIGVPFTVDLDLESGQQQNVTLNKILNLEKFEHKNNGVVNRLSVMNGVTQTHRTYSFLVRIDQVGQYTLGPAELSVNGKLIKSNQLVFQVIDNNSLDSNNHTGSNNNLSNSGPDNTGLDSNGNNHTGSNNSGRASNLDSSSRNNSNGPNNNLRNEPIFLKLLGPIKPVFVGEKFKLIIRIYSNLEQLQLTNLEQISHKNFKIGQLNKTSSGSIVIRNSTYSYQDYEQILSATQAGEFLIPALALDYAVPNRRSGWFFMNSYSSHQAYSNSLKITVQNLPKNKANNSSKINLMGVFKALQLTVNKSSLTKGEGGVIGLLLTGDTQRAYDLDGIKLDQLELPSALRAFYSKSERLAPDKLQFDFVVQGLQTGEFIIPAQKLNFFNPETARYQELITKPVKLTILDPDNSNLNNSGSSTNLNNTEDKNSNKNNKEKNNYDLNSCADLQIDHELNPIVCNLNLNSSAKLLIPKNWFINLVSLLFLGLASLGVLAGYKYYIKQAGYVRKRAFKQAELALVKVHSPQEISQIFLDLFSKLGIRNFSTSDLITKKAVTRDLLNLSVQVDQLASWSGFWQILVHASFAKHKVSASDLQKLVDTAQEWLKFWGAKL
jgi:hypothetical protein